MEAVVLLPALLSALSVVEASLQSTSRCASSMSVDPRVWASNGATLRTAHSSAFSCASLLWATREHEPVAASTCIKSLVTNTLEAASAQIFENHFIRGEDTILSATLPGEETLANMVSGWHLHPKLKKAIK
eukprot:CAMPEP_0115173114 /NCGR_PEP_ID=MMETSP0270-20121206/3163_1 /TAXON_ID=71861 /ORGANISM="Scrippsiella trochoidea, Strain CCMP3099" /LENGTH=130 /DNA_ID=CAMNT_0002585925 /DNA_START=421 /DNA_END=810 /DNA_ORIENTATION=+